MNLQSLLGITTELQPSARDHLMVLRDCCGCEKTYLDMIWSMRCAGIKPRRSHKALWPFQRAQDAVVVPASVVERKRQTRRQSPSQPSSKT